MHVENHIQIPKGSAGEYGVHTSKLSKEILGSQSAVVQQLCLHLS